ncbi:hypothetical protein LTS10_005551 [Elasticomyces elasticus]|nr:hypothetical protein LTS10_005551 [Elasticomyces elasticus]
MGFFSRWLRKMYVNLREKLDHPKYSDGRYGDFKAEVWFHDGSYMSWSGTPWGSAWEKFKKLVETNSVSHMQANMDGKFWSY